MPIMTALNKRKVKIRWRLESQCPTSQTEHQARATVISKKPSICTVICVKGNMLAARRQRININPRGINNAHAWLQRLLLGATSSKRIMPHTGKMGI